MGRASEPTWIAAALDTFGPLVDAGRQARDECRLDAWPLALKRQAAGEQLPVPAAVAKPRSTEDVARLLGWASTRSIPVVPRGAGSSVTGASLATANSLVLDLRRLDRVLELDLVNNRVSVEAGILGGQLETILAGEGVTTWFSPQSLHRSTVGGWVATRATGQFSSRFGGIEDAVAELRVVLGDGRVVRLGKPPRAAIGPELSALFTGSEGALGVISEVTLRLYPLTPLGGLATIAFPDLDTGLKCLRQLMNEGIKPALLRLYDASEGRYLKLACETPAATLLIAFTGHPKVAAAEEEAARAIIADFDGQALGSEATEAWLQGRYDFSRIENLLGERGGYAETIEIAHGWREILPTYQALTQALAPLADEVLGHFSHTYVDGTSLYVIVLGQASDDVEAVRRLEKIWDSAMETAIECGAAISHHHGIGQARRSYLGAQLGAARYLLEALDRALDPTGTLHPQSLRPTAHGG